MSTSLGTRSHLAGPVLGSVPGPRWLGCLGWVGSGFAETELNDFTARLPALEQPSGPGSPSGEVTYVEVTAAGRMRHPSSAARAGIKIDRRL